MWNVECLYAVRHDTEVTGIHLIFGAKLAMVKAAHSFQVPTKSPPPPHTHTHKISLVKSCWMSLCVCSEELVQSLFYDVFSWIFSCMSLYAVIFFFRYTLYFLACTRKSAYHAPHTVNPALLILDMVIVIAEWNTS